MKIQRKLRSLWTIILSTILMISPIMNVGAVSDSIQLGAASQTKSYIAGVTFSYKVTTKGQYLYCLNMHKNTAQNVSANLVKNSKYIDGGVLYILKNGYPNVNITNDKDKDYYITQTALWWYLDLTTGSENLGSQFKETGSDAYGLRATVKKLAYDGYAHRKDTIELKSTKLVLGGLKDSTMTLKDSYYVSGDIKATTAENISSYDVTLENAPSGTKIVSSNGVETVYSGAYKVDAKDSFKVKVPLAGVTGTGLTIKVNATAQGVEQYSAYEYEPVDKNMQNVALLEKTSDKVSSSINLDIVSSKVTITKVDTNTKEAIAGAVFALKDANGKEITRWTSTINAHVIRNLANGTYSIEEISAPTGYLKNTKATQFTLSDTNRDIKIIIENAPKVVVVNITKVDQETNAPLAGAVLTIKDSTGKAVATFTTTNGTYVVTDLPNGTYTVEEVSAPAGYMRSTEVKTFTIDDTHLSHQITIVNAKEVRVPDTASMPPILMVIIGAIITGFGLRFIYKNGKRA